VTISAGGSGGSTVLPGYIWGFTLSNDATTPNTILDIANGTATDSTGTVTITGTAFTKTISGTWVAGTGNAGMGTGLTATASTWYHVFAGIASGSYDVFFDTSLTAVNKPSAFTSFRYIGDIYLSSSTYITTFTQAGQKITWGTAPIDLNGGTALTETAVILSIPPGVVTFPILSAYVNGTVINDRIYIYPGTSTQYTTYIANQTTASISMQQVQTTSNVSRQISYKVDASSTPGSFYTIGYVNPYLSSVAQ
jgi:hypothetical protein